MSTLIKFSLLENELRTAFLFVSQGEARYAMMGVKVELAAGKRPLLIGTDGRRLCVIESSTDVVADGLNAELILKRRVLDLLPGIIPSPLKQIELFFEFDPEARTLRVWSPKGSVLVEFSKDALIEGTFFNWRRPISGLAKEPVARIELNANYLADFSKAGAFMHRPYPFLRFRLGGQFEPVEISINGVENFYCLLMPARAGDGPPPKFIEAFKGTAMAMPSPTAPLPSDGRGLRRTLPDRGGEGEPKAVAS